MIANAACSCMLVRSLAWKPSPFKFAGKSHASSPSLSLCVGSSRGLCTRPPMSLQMGEEGHTVEQQQQQQQQPDANVQQAMKALSAPVEIEDYRFEGISIGGHETCIIVPKLKVAFDIGRCPQRAIAQDFLFISHAHMDHIGGVAMYVATRGLYKMKPPTLIVPKCIKETVEKLFEVYRQLDGSELKYNLIGLDVGETYNMGKGLAAKAFKTYHVIPSQGYIIYSVRHKLKGEYLGLPGKEIKSLKDSGVEITYKTMVPEIAFTGDTMADFIVDEANSDVMNAKVLIMEATFVNDSMTVELAREFGHTHLSEVAALADRFRNKGILFIHFSARHRTEEIQTAMKNLPKRLQERAHAFLEGW